MDRLLLTAQPAHIQDMVRRHFTNPRPLTTHSRYRPILLVRCTCARLRPATCCQHGAAPLCLLAALQAFAAIQARRSTVRPRQVDCARHNLHQIKSLCRVARPHAVTCRRACAQGPVDFTSYADCAKMPRDRASASTALRLAT